MINLMGECLIELDYCFIEKVIDEDFFLLFVKIFYLICF